MNKVLLIFKIRTKKKKLWVKVVNHYHQCQNVKISTEMVKTQKVKLNYNDQFLV